MMDAKDGNCLSNGNKNEDQNDALGSTKYIGQNAIAKMVTNDMATHYKMNHKSRGIALIFNHETFKVTGLRPRAGTQTDCLEFKMQLKKLGFQVLVYNDLDYVDLHSQVMKAAQADHTDYDCFLLAVLTHGEMNILYARDTPYKPDSLWHPFTADKCPTLAGKPKLFFVQACQGDKLDAGITLTRTETDGHPAHSYRIPTHADFLIAYSTVPGFYSWRNTSKGSWFMQALCEELRNNSYEYDLLTLLTFVARRVAIDYESNTPDIPHMHRQKQIPCVTTMLTRILKFTKTD